MLKYTINFGRAKWVEAVIVDDRPYWSRQQRLGLVFDTMAEAQAAAVKMIAAAKYL